MSQYYPPPPLPPRYGGNNAAPRPPQQPGYPGNQPPQPPQQPYASYASGGYSNGYSSPQQTSYYGYSAPASGVASQTTPAPNATQAPYYPPPPPGPPPSSAGYPNYSLQSHSQSVAPVPAPQAPAQQTYQYHPPPIPPRAQQQQSDPAYYPPPTPSYTPAQPAPPAPYYSSPPPPVPYASPQDNSYASSQHTSYVSPQGNSYVPSQHTSYTSSQTTSYASPQTTSYAPPQTTSYAPSQTTQTTQYQTHYASPPAASANTYSPPHQAPVPSSYQPATQLYGTVASSSQQTGYPPPPAPPLSTRPPGNGQGNTTTYYPPPPPPSTVQQPQQPQQSPSTVVPTYNQYAPPPPTQQQPPPSSAPPASGYQQPLPPPPPTQAPQTPSYQPQYPPPPTTMSPPQQSGPNSQNAISTPDATALYRPTYAATAQVPAPPAPAPAPQRAPAQQQHGTATANPQDPLDRLASQMNDLNVGSRQPIPAPQTKRFVDDNAPRSLPIMRATGTPNDVLSFCPEQRVIDYSLYWYQLPEFPKYLICTKCHLDHIQGTRLESHFERVKQPDNIISICCFWFPRVKEILWPQALQTGSLDALCAFIKKRLVVMQCKGRVQVSASDGIKWFGMTNAEINGFISCEACYEDRVVGTPFESRFTAYQKQKEGEKWSCDLCVPYIARAVVKMAKRNDWSGFVAGATRRLSAVACEGKDVKLTTYNWYLPRHNIDNVRACEACYMDKLELTRFEGEFTRWTPANDLDSFITNMTTLWSCKLHEGNLPMAFALENAIERRDWSVFRNAAETICRLVPCTANGIIRGNWWTLSGGCANFDICEACYVGILQTSQIAQFFEPVQHNREETIVCDFCVASPRFGQYISKFAQSADYGVFSPYNDFVKKFAAVQVCPGVGTREKTKWWGYPEALFCEDCYLNFVVDTPLGPLVPIKGELDDRAQICQIWSTRMRTMWLEVCKAGAPGSTESDAALAEFKAFGEKRLQVYVNTVPRIDFIRKMKQLKMQNAMHQGLLSVMYNGMDGMAQVSGTTDGYLHGSSSLGWYATEQGATGAQMFNNMQAGFANANRVDEWMQMAQLEILWKEVE